MNYIIVNGELYHHGVKGMKWGVRRYQNPDGSLTPAGKKRYDNMSDDKLRKTLYKQVKKARSEQTDWSNQWRVNNTIGTNSKAVQDRYIKDYKDYMNSEPVKQAKKKFKSLDKQYEDGKIDHDQYESEWIKTQKSIYRPDLDNSFGYRRNGYKYSKAYLDTYGKDLNVAYLKDLGYNDSVAKEFANRVLKAKNRKLLNGM